MRAFTLLALGTVYCRGTGNYVNLKYLHSLVDISQLSSYDWAGHVIECLMDEVKKYKKFTPQQLENDHQMGSCLIVLAIAYIDHLDLPSDHETHQISYKLPRICNVTNADFDFMMQVDKNRMHLGHSFGKIPFCDISRTPYGTAAPLEDPTAPDACPIAPNIPEEAPVIPIEYQQVVAQYNNLMEQDVIKFGDSISASIKDQVMSIWKRQNAEMLAKMAERSNASRNDDGSACSASDVPGDANKTNDKPSDDGSAGFHTTSEHAAVTSTGAGGTSTSAGDVPGDANNINDKPSDKTSDHTSTGFYDDIPSFNLFSSGELNGSYVPIDNTPPEATNTGNTINNEIDVNKSGSRTHDKKNRRKRAAIHLNQGKKPKKLKVDEENRLAYQNYLGKRILKKVPPDPNG